MGDTMTVLEVLQWLKQPPKKSEVFIKGEKTDTLYKIKTITNYTFPEKKTVITVDLPPFCTFVPPEH